MRDIALRLYAAAEHMANAILNMFQVKDADIARFKGKNVSLQSAVARYLREMNTGHPVTEAVSKLGTSEMWVKTMDYRNNWVHNKPVIIEGIEGFRRETRWRKVSTPGGTNYILGVGGGDPADYKVDDLLAFTKSALFEFVKATRSVLECYKELLFQVNINPKGLSVGIL